jgi:NAD(P)-dependent dehydrogenase (short-subunit alcohol dehydrogenase family)
MSQRTWFITGISSGFGRYTTEQQLERGPVAGTFRKLEAIDDLKRQYGAMRERIEGGAYLPPGDPAKDDPRRGLKKKNNYAIRSVQQAFA